MGVILMIMAASGLLGQLIQADTQVFVWLNGFHSPVLDPLMAAITHRFFWIPFYVCLAAWLIWRVGIRRAVLQILAIGLVIVLSDMISSRIIKPGVARPRPCHVGTLAARIHVPLGCGGSFGFVSSHAANTFGLAFFLWVVYYKKHKYVFLIFIWAALVSYSRIYNGVHYPLDILGGAILGILAAGSVFYFSKKYLKKDFVV